MGAGSGQSVNKGFNQNFVFSRIGTQSVTVVEAGPYFVKGKITLPTIVGGAGASSLVVTINQNGSPKYTGSAGAEGFYTNLLCAANDVIAVVFSSAAAVDALENNFKANIQIGQGQ